MDPTTLANAALPSPSTVEVPAGTHNLPEVSRLFVGRTLSDLDGPLSTGRAVIGQTAQALGGIGKSEFAARYAWRHRGRYSLVWWITADSPENLTLGLTGLTARFHATPTLAEGRTWAIDWLVTHSDWLLILDNVEDSWHISPLLNRLGDRGQVLVTTRRDLDADHWRQLGLAPLPLGVLDREASVELLCRASGRDDPGGASRVASHLGDVPMALALAGAHLSQRPELTFDQYCEFMSLGGSDVIESAVQLTCDDYRNLLTSRFSRIVTGPMTEATPNQVVLRAWAVAMNVVGERWPLASTLLSALAHLAPDSVSVEILLGMTADRVALTNTLVALEAYNMITRVGQTIRVHRLVQLAVRESERDGGEPGSADGATAPDSEALPGLDLATRLLLDAAPQDPLTNIAGWSRWRTLLPHIDVIIAHLPDGHKNTEILHLADRAAIFLQGQGELDRATDFHEWILSDRERVLGEDHPDTLASRHRLAYALQTAGDLERAIALYERVLTDRERVLGEDHPDTLASHNNLAYAFTTAGDLERAIALYERVLMDRERVLGEEHPDTLASRHRLAYALQTAGDLDEALDLYERVLRDRERVLGEDHPDTLASRYRLAYACQMAGRMEDAIVLNERVLADRQRLLGDQHPDTVTARNYLAFAYQTAGDLEAAIGVYERVLLDCQRARGGQHPDTLAARHRLGYVCQTAGRLDQAIDLYEGVLADRRRLLGDEHPDTVASRNNLACAYQSAGRKEAAIDLFEEILADYRRILGCDHPATVKARSILADVYHMAEPGDQCPGDDGAALVEDAPTPVEEDPEDEFPAPDATVELPVASSALVAVMPAPLCTDVLVPIAPPALPSAAGSVESAEAPTGTDAHSAVESVEPADSAVPAPVPVPVPAPAVAPAVVESAVPVVEPDPAAPAAVAEVAEDPGLSVLACGQRVWVLGASASPLPVRLAYPQRTTNEVDRLVDRHLQVLADRERVLGRDHPDAIAARASLAGACQSAGRTERAIALFKQVVVDRERVLGRDHPDAIAARASLAGAYQAVGRIDDAITLHRQILETRLRASGSDHPDAVAARDNLAGVCGIALRGRLSGASRASEARKVA